MAESVKRRVAAARLAVAFVAAGTIAGATAWAQAGPPPPTAQSSAFDSFLKIDSIKGENIVDGSLLFKDFKKHEVPSYKQFQKVEIAQRHFKKATLNRYYPKVEIDKLFIKGESTDYIKRAEISSYIKGEDADARYIKLSDSVVRGDGSVFTESALLADPSEQRMLSISGLVDVDAVNGPSPHMKVTNSSSGPLTHTSCGDPQTPTPAGIVQPGESFSCPSDDASQTIQLIGEGANPIVATLSFSGVPAVQGSGDTQFTTQILIGM
jgi:hypothetical protein